MQGNARFLTLSLAILLSLVIAKRLTHGSACHRSGFFVASERDFALPVTEIVVELVSSAVECAMKCITHSQCLSVNFQHTSSLPTHFCELLDATVDDGLQLASRPWYTHYDPQKEVCLGCKNNASCQFGCDQKPFCECTPSFTGETCEEPAQLTFDVAPEGYAVPENTKATLHCSSSTATSYTWYLNDNEIDFTNQKFTLFGNGTLEISDFSSSEQGAYKCGIVNLHYSNTSEPVPMVVLGPPSVVYQTVSSSFVFRGDYATISVTPTPYCVIDTWYKDGEVIDLTTYNAHVEEGNKFVISSTTKDNNGSYSARVVNQLGSIVSEPMDLIIIDRCPFIEHPVNGIRRGYRHAGAVMKYQCYFKYKMIGVATATCQEDTATWSSPAPTCVEDISGNHPVRLTGSTRDNEGNVEIFSGNQWGAIGHAGWDISDANVVCRQLGFPGAIRVHKYSKFGESTGAIYMTDVTCTGNEATLSECTAIYDTVRVSGNETAGVLCQNVRLGGGGSHQGLLEVYTGGRWGTVCDDQWSMANAHVVCTQLGFGSAVTFSSGSVQGTGDIVLDDVVCVGREESLLHCPNITDHNCNHGEDISVECSTLRLADSDSYSQGRVEMYSGGEWGTVCDDDWSTEENDVVCRELGFPGAIKKAFFGPGTGPILHDGSACVGNEARYADCPKSNSHNCNHDEDIGVVCQPHVRLVGSDNYFEGRVEVWVSGTWGTVCDDMFDMNDGDVVCRMLGFDGAVDVKAAAYYGQGSGVVHYAGLDCDGEESRVEYCPVQASTATCGHEQDVGVQCQYLRTSGSSLPSNGRIELYYNNTWGTIANTEVIRGIAFFICEQLGSSSFMGIYNNPENYGQGTGEIHMKDLSCIRTEENIFQCNYSMDTTDSSHANDISVRCGPGSTIPHPTQGGPVSNFRHGFWNRVCADNWGYADAEVACRDSGYHLGVFNAYTTPRYTAYGLSRAGLECTGEERALSRCKQGAVDISTCTHDAAVQCQDLRLRGGPTYYEGRLEVYRYLGIWGVVCGKNWDIRDANVACAQLGFKARANATYEAGSSLAKTSWNFKKSEVYCFGTEYHLRDCPSGGDTAGCSPENEVWVKCNP